MFGRFGVLLDCAFGLNLFDFVLCWLLIVVVVGRLCYCDLRLIGSLGIDEF